MKQHKAVIEENFVYTNFLGQILVNQINVLYSQNIRENGSYTVEKCKQLALKVIEVVMTWVIPLPQFESQINIYVR